MKPVIRSIAIAVAFAALSAVAQRAGPSLSQELTDEITVADKALFTAVFDTCDTTALAKMVTGDFEMYHDKDGVALFTHVWKREPSGWKLARVLSYDHHLTDGP